MIAVNGFEPLVDGLVPQVRLAKVAFGKLNRGNQETPTG